MRCVFQAPLREGIKVQLLLARLEAEGVRAEVRNEILQGLMVEVGYVPVAVWILDDADAERAERITKEFLQGAEPAGSDPASPPADWVCPSCRETVEGNFAACWNCGATCAPSPCAAGAPRMPLRSMDTPGSHPAPRRRKVGFRIALALALAVGASGIVAWWVWWPRWNLEAGNRAHAADRSTDAARLWARAARRGIAEAQYNLGVCYATGQGVPQDHATAVEWYQKAAEQGDAWAQSNLGFCYANGEGIPQDHATAVEWYQKAAEQGDAWAQHSLGVCYAGGQGVPRDDVEAYVWFLLSAAQGNEDAIEARDTLEWSMTPEQITRAEERSREIQEALRAPGREGCR